MENKTAVKSPLISPAELSSLIGKDELVLLDARAGSDAKQRYLDGHLQGAIHVDLEKDLSRPPVNAAEGGRHPLPEPGDFAALLGTLGIDPGKRVVVYDDKSGANAAARCWWMLRSIGHENVQVLDGGLQAALQNGLPVSKDVPRIRTLSPYPGNKWNWPLVSVEEVEKRASDPGWMVIDVREAYRYHGETEPIDLTAGHIPGAVNFPYPGNLAEDGRFRDAVTLKTQYDEALGHRPAEQVIVHCGSGVTACHTLLALEQAGIHGAQLYIGSWSEWSRTGRPIATTDK
jgi:thiosulfate/3-mercaptopyruvate sulfurtransferase